MMQLDELYQEAYDSDIYINNFSFSKTKKSACVKDGDYKTIILDKSAIETSREEKALLAEELAHYETGSLYRIEASYNTPLERSNRRKFEAQARKKAVESLISVEEIQKCFDNYIFDICEIAEILDTTPNYVFNAIELYKTRNQLSFDLFYDN